MAVVLGTSSGFVITAPTADPTGGVNTTIDGSSVVTKHTSPVGAVSITEIGWYRGAGTNTANFEIALYDESGGVAGARLFVDATNSSNVQGWIVTAVNWAISANTAYWLAVQMDAHTGSSTIDSETSGGAGIDVLTAQTTLNNPFGGGAVSDADGMMAIYAKVSVAVSVAPGVGALTVTGFAPVVATSNNINITPSFGELIVTGFAPIINIGTNSAPSTGALIVTGFAPAVTTTDHINITPSVGALVVTGFAPTVTTSNHQNAITSKGDLVVTGFAPTVTTSDHINIQTSLGELTIVGFAPTISISNHIVITPSFGELIITGFAPTVTIGASGATAEPGTGVLTITGFAPVVATSDHVMIVTSTGELVVEGHAPVVTTAAKEFEFLNSPLDNGNLNSQISDSVSHSTISRVRRKSKIENDI